MFGFASLLAMHKLCSVMTLHPKGQKNESFVSRSKSKVFCCEEWGQNKTCLVVSHDLDGFRQTLQRLVNQSNSKTTNNVKENNIMHAIFLKERNQ